jgi:hypothetical protein
MNCCKRSTCKEQSHLDRSTYQNISSQINKKFHSSLQATHMDEEPWILWGKKVLEPFFCFHNLTSAAFIFMFLLLEEINNLKSLISKHKRTEWNRTLYKEYKVCKDDWLLHYSTTFFHGVKSDGKMITNKYIRMWKRVAMLLVHQPAWQSTGVFFKCSPRLKRPGHEADHSPPSRTKFKNGGAIPALPHVFMAYCLIN